MTAPAEGSRFKLEPDPPVAGQPAVLHYTGRSTSVTYNVDGGPPVTVTVPPSPVEIASVPAGTTLWASDGTGENAGVDSWVIDEPEDSR